MADPVLFVATPLHDGRVHLPWVTGVLSLHAAFPGRYLIETLTSSFLPQSRDTLAMRFLDSPATHLLFVDSDIGWDAGCAQRLLAAGKDVVSGGYCRKGAERKVPVTLNGKRAGELYGATKVPGGFLLIARAVIERLVGANRRMQYVRDGLLSCALFMPSFEGGQYSTEDAAFCRRWLAIGGEIWVHPGVVLSHHGDSAFVPETRDGVAALEGKTD